MTSLIAEEIGDNNKNGMTNTLSPGIINNTKDNAGGTAGGQDEMTELQLTFAF